MVFPIMIPYLYEKKQEIRWNRFLENRLTNKLTDSLTDLLTDYTLTITEPNL